MCSELDENAKEVRVVMLRSIVKRKVVIFLQALVEGRGTEHTGDEIPTQVLKVITVVTLKRRLQRLEALCAPHLHARRKSSV